MDEGSYSFSSADPRPCGVAGVALVPPNVKIVLREFNHTAPISARLVAAVADACETVVFVLGSYTDKRL